MAARVAIGRWTVPSTALRLAVVIVTYNTGGRLVEALDRIAMQRRPGDRVVVVDNASEDGSAELAARHPGVDVAVRTGANLGFAAGCNRGAARAGGDTDAYVFLNPDCLLEPGAMDALRTPPADWDAWCALVTLADGESVNAAGNDVHFLGFAWSARYGWPVSELPTTPVPVPSLSGACLAIRRDAFAALDGFEESFFLYCEDLDLSLRLRLGGYRIGLLAGARVRHDYTFGKGADKWRLLERNRWLVVMRCFPGRLLAAVLPVMLISEPALLLLAVLGGWGPAKLRAQAGVLRALPAALAARNRIHAHPAIRPAAFADGLRAELDSPYFGAVGRSAFVRGVLRGLWAAIRFLSRTRPASA